MSVDLGFDKEKLGGFIKQVQADPAVGRARAKSSDRWLTCADAGVEAVIRRGISSRRQTHRQVALTWAGVECSPSSGVHSGGSGGLTPAAGRHNRRSGRAKLTLHGPWAVGETVWETTTQWRHGFQSEAHIRTHSLRSLLDLYGHSLDGMNRALSWRVRMQQRTIGRTHARRGRSSSGAPLHRAPVVR